MQGSKYEIMITCAVLHIGVKRDLSEWMVPVGVGSR